MTCIPLLPPGAPLWFPPVEQASEDGVVAAGGDLSPERLVLAYTSGLFPWYDKDSPILWWSPDPRCVLFPHEVHIPRRLARDMRRGRFRFTFNAAFEQVIERCASAPRPGQKGTWLIPEMIAAYKRLHALGVARSVEAWECVQGEKEGGAQEILAGGLYGVLLGQVFFGESMFYARPDGSKAAVAALVAACRELGVEMIDCQQTTAHMVRFGAREIPRPEFIRRVRKLVG